MIPGSRRSGLRRSGGSPDLFASQVQQEPPAFCTNLRVLHAVGLSQSKVQTGHITVKQKIINKLKKKKKATYGSTESLAALHHRAVLPEAGEMVRGEGTGWSEVQAQQALGYITALLGNASYHAGVSFGSKGRDFALRTGRGPDIWLDKSSSVYQTGKQKGKGARGKEFRK